MVLDLLFENTPDTNGDVIIDSRETIIQDNALLSSGNISISTDRLDVLDSGRISSTAEGLENIGGIIEIVAKDSVNIVANPDSDSPSSILSTVGRPGSGGTISIDANRLVIRNGSQLSANINGGGTGGSIIIEAKDSVIVEGTSSNGNPSQISAELNLNGAEFGVVRSIRSQRESVQGISSVLDGSIVVFTRVAPSSITSVDNTGGRNEINLGGSAPINTDNFVVQRTPRAQQTLLINSNVPDDGTLLLGSSFGTDFESSIAGGEVLSLEDSSLSEDLGLLFLDSLESILRTDLEAEEAENDQKVVVLENVDAVRESFLDNAGELYVVRSTENEFKIRDAVYTDITFSQIEPGDLFLVFAVRDGGNISIETGSLTVRDGAAISTALLGAATGKAAASQLGITANSVLLEDNSTISAISETGSGGNITVRTSDIRLNNNSTLTASARENASGGNVIINAESGTVRTSNSNILSSSANVGGGNVVINARNIQFDGDSDIQANVSGGSGDGGNINLTADYIIAFDDSDIFADARGGSGGIISLNTPAFFGDGFTAASLNADPATLESNNRADINATGVVNGVVSVPDVNSVENGLASLPDTVIAPDQLIASSCIARSDDGQGTLVTTGGEGLANSPDAALATPLSTGTVQAIGSPTEGRSQDTEVSLDEPTGVYQLADGRLVIGKACL